jgi:hypothetical protein
MIRASVAGHRNTILKEKKLSVGKSRNAISRTQDRKTCIDFKIDMKSDKYNADSEKPAQIYQTISGNSNKKADNAGKSTSMIGFKKSRNSETASKQMSAFKNKAAPLTRLKTAMINPAKKDNKEKYASANKKCNKDEQKRNSVLPLKSQTQYESGSKHSRITPLIQQYVFFINK